ncbi:MAG: pentapeptide repeat-containing protein, partial [Planctomycetaceae bacterium]
MNIPGMPAGAEQWEPLTVAEFFRRLAAGEPVRRALVVAAAEPGGKDAIPSPAGRRFDRAILEEVMLVEVPLAGVTFEAADWHIVGLTKCDLGKAVFAGGRLHDVLFAESGLGGSAWRGIALDAARFIGCNLDETAFADVTITKGLVAGGQCARAKVSGGSWADTSLLEVALDATVFTATTLSGCEFGGCTGAGLAFESAAVLADCQFRRCKTPGLTVAGTIRGSGWTASDLGDAALAAATLERAAFR